MSTIHIVKDERPENPTCASVPENSSGSDKMFIVQVTNYKGEVGYMGERDGRGVILNVVNANVKKFTSYTDAKKYSNRLAGVTIEILGSHRIEKILEKQGIDITIPVNQLETDIFWVVVKEKATGAIAGYLHYKSATQEYSLMPVTEGAAFWQTDEGVDAFIKLANAQFFSNQPDLFLEKAKVQ